MVRRLQPALARLKGRTKGRVATSCPGGVSGPLFIGVLGATLARAWLAEQRRIELSVHGQPDGVYAGLVGASSSISERVDSRRPTQKHGKNWARGDSFLTQERAVANSTNADAAAAARRYSRGSHGQCARLPRYGLRRRRVFGVR
jgi:hypothetical protein